MNRRERVLSPHRLFLSPFGHVRSTSLCQVVVSVLSALQQRSTSSLVPSEADTILRPVTRCSRLFFVISRARRIWPTEIRQRYLFSDVYESDYLARHRGSRRGRIPDDQDEKEVPRKGHDCSDAEAAGSSSRIYTEGMIRSV